MPCGVVAQQNADRVLGLPDLAFEVRNLCVGNVEHLPRLQYVKLRAHAVLDAQFS
jgi:hypothetical protein